jgi:ribosomal protein L21E
MVHSNERNLLWSALRERANQSQAYTVGDIPDLDIDPSILAQLLGIKEFTGKYET